MHYLGLALYAEGPTDYYFLLPLLERVCIDLCLREVRGPVDVSPVLGLDHPQAYEDRPREQRILEAARSALGQWSVLFIHTDGAGDVHRMRDQLVEPALAALLADGELAAAGRGVAVIPVRETEAWALVDGDALRLAFGTRLDDEALGLPQPTHRAEAVIDPKKLLADAFAVTRPTGSRRRRGASDHLSMLGEQVSLPQLRQLASFRVLEQELQLAFRSLSLLT